MKKYTIFLFAAMVFLFQACASEKSAAYAYDSGSGNGNGRNFASFEDITEKSLPKKVIYTSSINLTVKIPDSANVQIQSIAKKYNGYVQQSGTTLCVIRVEEKSLKLAEADISLLGRVDSKTATGKDVTNEYLDYVIRLENAQKARERYLELLAKAENVEAALKVEKELERLNETIELMKGQMNRIDHLSAYSTINVYLKEKKKPGLIGYIGIGLYQGVKWLFVRN